MKKIKLLLSAIFGVRRFSNYQIVRFPPYLVSASLLILTFVAYLIGGIGFEYELRITFLAAFACSLPIAGSYFLNQTFSRWVTILAFTGFVFWLAAIWQQALLLNFLVLPVILAMVMINQPAMFLTAILETALVLYSIQLFPEYPLNSPEKIVLISMIWLAGFAVWGGYFLIERFFLQASEDYDRLQNLLGESRLQQAKLAQILDDLSHANRQLSLLYDKNITLRKIAEEATEAKTTYIARVSHEIRTPLNMILGITESIIEDQEMYEEELPLDLVDDIKIVHRNSEHLLSLVNDVLDLTRAEANQMILKREWIDIRPEIEKSLEIVQPLAKKKKLGLHFDIPPVLPQVYCDRTRIRQVILNLLSNAVRYTDQGEVRVQASADENYLTVRFTDTGLGIDPADAERIFEPFYRGTNSARQETVGTGLGLSVSRQLVELHGGKVWLESQQGLGSSFFFRLPLSRADGAARSPARFVSEQWVWVERERGHAAYTLPSKKRVVICASADLLWSKLDQLSDQVEFTQVNSIPELQAEIEQIPAHLILMNAPSIGNLLENMQQAKERIKDTPIIGSTFTFLSEQLRHIGAADYLQKPFSNKQLRKTVGQVAPGAQRILVVDDNPDVQKLIVHVLRMENEREQFYLAANGREALEVIRRRKPDLVLLDLALPEIDGWGVLAEMKNDPGLCEIPVILISAHDLNETPPRSEFMVIAQGNGISMDGFVKDSLKYLPAE